MLSHRADHLTIATFVLIAALRPLAAAPLDNVIGDKDLLSGRIMTIWNDRNGLPSNTVLDIAQDGDGYVWIASYEGLIRFDGSAFSTFSGSDGRGFSALSARELALDREGGLWIGTNDDGVYLYKGGAFRRFGQAEGLGDPSVRALGFDSSGALWVGTAKAVYRFDGKLFAKVGAKAGFGVARFFLDIPGIGLLAGSNFPGLWIAKAEGVEPWAGSPPELSRSSFSAAARDAGGVLWLGTDDGTVFRVKDGKVIERRGIDSKESASVNAIVRQSDGAMRIGTDKGLVSYKLGRWSRFSTENGLPNDTVSSLCEDREGNVWLGTERGGLVKFSAGKFVTLNKKGGLVDDAVNATTEDSYGSLWVATDQGVSFHASARDPIVSDRGRERAVESLIASLKGVRVRQIRLAKDGSLWFATYSERSLVRFDGKSSSAYGKKDGLPSDRVRMSCETSDGAVLAGTTTGIAVIRGSAVEAIGPAQGLPNHYVMDITELSPKDASGAGAGAEILAATDGGGVVILRDGKVAGIVDKKSGLAGNVVFRFFRDSGGRLWVCTGEGVTLWESGKVSGSVTTKTGLPWASVFQMMEVEPGTLWLVSSKGIAVVEAATLEALARGATLESLARGATLDLRVRVIDQRDGLAGQLSANAWAYRSAAGRAYLPTMAGVSIYDAARSAKNTVAPPVKIEGVEVDGSTLSPPPAELKLAPGARRVTFRFAALSFVEPSKVDCRYKLSGYDLSWADAGTARSVSYTNLPPGNYSFRVSATNDDGVMSESEASLSVGKSPYFWQTWPAYVAAGAALAGLGFLVAFARLRKLEARRRELERLVQERTRDLEDEKATSEALLLNILPYRVANELKRNGSSTPVLYPDATVLFADLVGFTEACAELSPEATIEELNALFTAFDDIVAQLGGERIKTIGDAYLAAAGMDGHDPEHSLKMCRAARDIMIELERRTLEGHRSWKARIGIHSGSVVGGVVGVRKYIYDIFGDAVNTASRLQSSSVPDGICISRPVADRVRSKIVVVDRPPRAVKGKGDLPMSFIAWRSEDPRAGAASRAAYDRGIEACARGDYRRALDLLESADYSLIEPEAGHHAWKAVASCYFRLGNSEGAARALRTARSYGIHDPVLEKSLDSISSI
jgi:ligand-binding sensor domain-containing protein/class 3 adenylate cyclase